MSPIDAVYADQVPGEFREYEIDGSESPVQIRFYKGRAVAFVVYTDGATDPVAAMAMAGFDVSDTKPSVVAPAARRWHGLKAGNMVFSDVAALEDDGEWHMVIAKIGK